MLSEQHSIASTEDDENLATPATLRTTLSSFLRRGGHTVIAEFPSRKVSFSVQPNILGRAQSSELQHSAPPAGDSQSITSLIEASARSQAASLTQPNQSLSPRDYIAVLERMIVTLQTSVLVQQWQTSMLLDQLQVNSSLEQSSTHTNTPVPFSRSRWPSLTSSNGVHHVRSIGNTCSAAPTIDSLNLSSRGTIRDLDSPAGSHTSHHLPEVSAPRIISSPSPVPKPGTDEELASFPEIIPPTFMLPALTNPQAIPAADKTAVEEVTLEGGTQTHILPPLILPPIRGRTSLGR